MSETEPDSEYYGAAEAAFIRRRGTPFLLSPKDFSLLKEWRALGVPLDAIERGIDDAFSRREERGATGRVNSLFYCRDAVLSAWERRAEVATGRGKGRRSAEPETESVLVRLSAKLSEIGQRRAGLEAPLDAAARSLERLKKLRKSAEDVEASLARIDKKLAAALYAAMPEEERHALDAEVEASIARARVRMDEQTAEKTTRALTRRAVRQKLELPRLTLL